jgi:hypothetical protein
MVSQLVKKFPAFIEPKALLPCSQRLATEPGVCFFVYAVDKVLLSKQTPELICSVAWCKYRI